MTRAMAAARSILADVFGYGEFRGGQAEAVAAITSGRDTVVLLPTGAGKSLCYQVPGLLESRSGGGTTIVISPLIALMQDQIEALRGRGVTCAAIHSHLTDFDRIEAGRAFARGELEFLYCSPERAATPSFKRLVERTHIAMIAIDEAHCLSQWGHDFRPEYLRLSELVELAAAPTIALTATATPRVIDEIVSRLGLRDPAIIRGDFSRPNLCFTVEHHRGDAERIKSLTRALERADLRRSGRAIVYCATRKKTETVAKALTSAGFSATHYHAGRTPLARERAKTSFDRGRRRVLVATNAFGMGIDYPDVRLIVHFQAPGSLEAYYQEAGRAGRDGEPARCVLYFGKADLVTQRRLASGGARAGVRDDALAALEDYARGEVCRQRAICNHFIGEDSGLACGVCDVCADPDYAGAPPDEVTVAAEPLDASHEEVIVAAIGRLSRPVGKAKLAKALRGSKAKTLARGGLLTMPEFGALAGESEAAIVATIDELLSRRVLEMRGKKYPTVWLRGRPVREKRTAEGGTKERTASRGRRHHTPITRALDNYRRKQARSLSWKPYMVFQKRAIVAIEEQRPRSLDDLLKIPGLGPAKVERFGEDILALVRERFST